jgi:hypothetical protein
MTARDWVTNSNVASSTGTEERSTEGAISAFCDATLTLWTADLLIKVLAHSF